MLYVIFQFLAFQHHFAAGRLVYWIYFHEIRLDDYIPILLISIVTDYKKKRKKEEGYHLTMKKRKRDKFAFLSLIADRHTINSE